MTEVAIKNIDFGKTRITDKIRVSSAAIWYELHEYYQLETWIFSDDKERYKSKQTIHGTCTRSIPESLIQKTKTFHRRVANGLIKKFNQ